MYEKLLHNLERIKKILPQDREVNFNYTDEEKDRIKAYFILAHAQIETYIEECINAFVSNAYDTWLSENKPNNVLLNLLAYYHPAICGKSVEQNKRSLKDGTRALIEQCKKSFDHDLRTNHGIQDNHIEEFLKIINFDLNLNSTFLPNLNSFSTIRGEYAHKAESKNPATPQEAIRNVQKIIDELKSLEDHHKVGIG